MQNKVISTRITSPYWSQPSSVVFGCKTASFGQELQVSMGPRLHLSFWAYTTAWFAPEWQVYMGSSPHLCFFPCKTASLGPDLQVSMGPILHLSFCACIRAYLASQLLISIGPVSHLRFLHAKQRLLDQNYKSLCVPDLTCHFVHENECE